MWEKIGLILLAGLLFSLTITGVDLAVDEIPPATLTILRMTTASIVFGSMLLLLRPKYCWRWRGIADLVTIGFLNVGLPFFCLAVSVKYISGSLAAVLFNTTPIFTLLMAHFLLPDEKLNLVKLVGTLTAVIGAVILLLSNATGLTEPHPLGWLGQLLTILASLCTAISIIYTRLQLRIENTLILAGGQMFAGLAMVAPLALTLEGLPALSTYSWQSWLALIVAALCGPVVGLWLLFYIINKHSASLAGFAGIATPFFSVVVGLLFLDEVLTAPIMAGMFFLLIGVWSLHYF